MHFASDSFFIHALRAPDPALALIVDPPDRNFTGESHMAVIITFEKSCRPSAAEPLAYIHRDLGGTMLLLPWFTVTIHRGDWQVNAAAARRRGFDAFLTRADRV